MKREKKYPAENLERKKNILPTRLLEKKNLLTRNHPPPPPPPSRVKWSAPKRISWNKRLNIVRKES